MPLALLRLPSNIRVRTVITHLISRARAILASVVINDLFNCRSSYDLRKIKIEFPASKNQCRSKT